MSGILQKLKGKPLFERLLERFPTEVVNPYGEVLIIPSNQFKNEWSPKLEAEGFETFSSSYGVQSCFFVRKKKQPSIQEPERDSKPSPAKEKKPLTPEERATVIQLHQQGLSGKQIAEKVGCSIQAIGGLVCHLKRSKEKHEEIKSKKNDPEIIRDLKIERAAPKYCLNCKACGRMLVFKTFHERAEHIKNCRKTKYRYSPKKRQNNL